MLKTFNFPAKLKKTIHFYVLFNMFAKTNWKLQSGEKKVVHNIYF